MCALCVHRQGERYGLDCDGCVFGGGMAHVYRLIAAVLLAWLTVPAMADGGPFPAAVTYDYQGQSYSTASAACAAYIAYVQPRNPGNTYSLGGITESGSQTICKVNASAGSDSWVDNVPIGKSVSSCPAGANASTGTSGERLCTCTAGLRPKDGQCVALPTCPEGQHEEGGACVPDACKPNETRVNGVCVPEPPCPTGQTRVNGKCVPSKCPSQGTVSDQWFEVTSPGTSATCLYNGNDGSYCTMSVKPSVIASADGRTTYMGGYGVYTGGTCGPSEPGKPAPQDPAKPDGDPNDGTKPPGPNDPRPGEKPGGNPGGPGNNPTPPGPDGKCPDGTYKSNGNCYQKDPPKLPPDNDGKCPNGYIKAGSQCVPLMPPEDKDPEEKDPSSFGGQCDAVTCDGDAIQCAIARDQYRRSCQLMDKESAESQLYHAEKSKTGKRTDDLPGNETIAFGQSMFSSANMLGPGTCIGDVHGEIMGQSITLPVSNVCSMLGTLRYALLAFGALLWVIIVFRG